MWLTLILLGVFTLLLLYVYKFFFQPDKDFWGKYGIKQLDGRAVASNFQIAFGIKDPTERDTYAYKQMESGGDKFCGMIESSKPIIVIKDLDLIKKVLIKDFEFFPDTRDFFEFLPKDNIFKKMLFLLTGEDWKNVRSALTPTFTTGKIKKMMDKFNCVGKEWVSVLRQDCKNSESGKFAKVPVVTYTNNFTLEVIGRSVFGMKLRAIENVESDFTRMVDVFVNPSVAKFMFGMTFPNLTRMLGIDVLDIKKTEKVLHILEQGLKERLNGKVRKNDFIQLLADLKTGSLKDAQEDELSEFEKEGRLKGGTRSNEVFLSDDMLNAQSILFLIAGFNTVANGIIFALYALAVYPDIQEKVREEVERVMKDGEIGYDELSELTYMDMLISEILRKYPAGGRLERQCIKEYHDPESGLHVPKGTSLVIPVVGLHNDTKYFKNPDKFDPVGNFGAEAKANRSPYAYLPFGAGPRNCIGMRFALVETKAAIAHVVHNFRLEPTEKTPVPIKAIKSAFQYIPPPDLELKFIPRN